MKKKIIIAAFLILLFITSFIFITAAIESYNYDMDPANGVDILEGFGAVLIMIVGGIIVFYELDLFYTVYYFFCKAKTLLKTILNIVSNAFLLFIVFATVKPNDFINQHEILILVAFLIYVILRLAYLIVSTSSLNEED